MTSTTPTPQTVAVPECRYACADRGVHCPAMDPLEAILADRQRDRWVPYWDKTEARLVCEAQCTVCSAPLIYVALAQSNEALGTAWALCSGCRHWVAL